MINNTNKKKWKSGTNNLIPGTNYKKVTVLDTNIDL